MDLPGRIPSSRQTGEFRWRRIIRRLQEARLTEALRTGGSEESPRGVPGYYGVQNPANHSGDKCVRQIADGAHEADRRAADGSGNMDFLQDGEVHGLIHKYGKIDDNTADQDRNDRGPHRGEDHEEQADCQQDLADQIDLGAVDAIRQEAAANCGNGADVRGAGGDDGGGQYADAEGGGGVGGKVVKTHTDNVSKEHHQAGQPNTRVF